MGGAGNEFFQIARATNLWLHGKNVELIYLGCVKKLLYKLIGFTNHKTWIDARKIGQGLGIKVRKASFIEMTILFILYVSKKLGFSDFFDNSFKKRLSKFEGSFFFNSFDVGYFQTRAHISKKSIVQVAEQITNLLNFSNREFSAELVVHVRGGDVLPENKISNYDANQIIDFCESNFLKLSCVTNDVLFVRSKFKAIHSKIEIKGHSPREDFEYLSTAKILYLSNSSFAFWAAVCASKLTNPILFGPKNWSFDDFIKIQKISNYNLRVSNIYEN